MKKLITFIVALALVLAFSLPLMAQDDTGKRVIKDAIVGAGTGAIAAGATGGKAGTGALIGAGTGAIGGVLMDVITEPSGSKTSQQAVSAEELSAQEVYQTGYEKGYKAGFNEGFKEGLKKAQE